MERGCTHFYKTHQPEKGCSCRGFKLLLRPIKKERLIFDPPFFDSPVSVPVEQVKKTKMRNDKRINHSFGFLF
jgi:hypothetical protein